MKENTHAYYKLNRRTVGIAVMLTVVLPAAFYWGSAAFAGKVQPLGSRRGEQWYISNKKEETAAQE
ncbi:hypothetical protein DFJ77DRAFT_30813 [Powellomyces hirtus]|nr:hypothetical protein DFJ77DRAFT_30813 [Powellomyces hirtus]